MATVNKQAVAAAFGRAASGYTQHDELQRRCADLLLRQLARRDFAQVLDAGRSSQPLLSASFVMFIVCAVLGGFLGASEIPRDISSDLILIILSKPIKKIDYMLGKYFGMLIVCACLFVISEADSDMFPFYLCHNTFAEFSMFYNYSFSQFVRQFLITLCRNIFFKQFITEPGWFSRCKYI